jgi:valyl-tRNA synthetase
MSQCCTSCPALLIVAVLSPPPGYLPGAGAVKITPAHDPNDFATGKRHNLEFINVFDDNGNLNSNGTGEFAGQPRFKV